MPEFDRLAALEQHRGPLEAYEELLRSLDDQGGSQSAHSNWVYRRDSPDASRYEGAIGEAVALDFLRGRVDSVRALPAGKEPNATDFLCEVGGAKFVVEVAGQQARTTTRPAGMPATPEPWEIRYQNRNWVRQIEDLVRRRSSPQAGPQVGPEAGPQAGSEASKEEARDLPRLVLVTVLHPDATETYCHRGNVEAALCEVIEGETDEEAGGWDAGGGDAGEEGPDDWDVADTGTETNIERALFAHVGDGIRPRFRSISGFIQAGLGFYPSRTSAHGGINPDAEHAFDPALLGDIPFAAFENWPAEAGETVSFKWSGDQESGA